MNIIAGADFHGSEAAFTEFASEAEELGADVIIVCGDITHFGSAQEARDMLSILSGLRIPLLFIPGNCDPKSLIGMDVEGAYCIHGEYRVYDDTIFYGVGGSPITPFNTPFEMSEDEIYSLLNKRSDVMDIHRWFILASHSPPKNTELDRIYSGAHVGSESLRRFIEERSPSLVLCGHVHEARGIDRIGDTIIVNTGYAKDGEYVFISLDEEIEVYLRKM